MLHESKQIYNDNSVGNPKYSYNDISDDLDDLDLENLLYACTAGGELGRASAAYFQRYIAQSLECSEHAIRVLERMEARQRGGRR